MLRPRTQSSSPDMSTIADVATSNPVSVSPSSHAVEARSPDRRRSHFGEWLLGFVLLSGLAAFNVWWYWRDTRPLPDYTTVSEWIQREQYAKAEAALRRAPSQVTARLRGADHAGPGDGRP